MLLYIITWIHIAVILFVSFYVFLFKKNRFDYAYIAYIYLVILHWTFFNGECCVSYIYKRLKYDNYNAGDNLKDNELTSLLHMNPNTVFIMANIHILFVILNLWLIVKRNRIPSMLFGLFILLVGIMFYGSQIFETHKNKSYQVLLEVMKYILIAFGMICFWILRKRFIRHHK